MCCCFRAAAALSRSLTLSHAHSRAHSRSLAAFVNVLDEPQALVFRSIKTHAHAGKRWLLLKTRARKTQRVGTVSSMRPALPPPPPARKQTHIFKGQRTVISYDSISTRLQADTEMQRESSVGMFFLPWDFSCIFRFWSPWCRRYPGDPFPVKHNWNKKWLLEQEINVNE